MDDLKKILSNKIEPINNQKLADYLKGDLSKQEQYNVELGLNENDPFLQDAIDGLKDTKIDIDLTIFEINNKLKKKLVKDQKKTNRKLNIQSIILIAVLLVLLLMTVGYIITRLLLHKND